VLATLREGRAADEPLALAATLPAGHTEALCVGPLDRDELRGLLTPIVDSISRPALQRIHTVSGGNPLYALELARGATAVGLQPGGLALPVSLRAAIAGRLATVGDDVAALLQAVSALAHTTVGELSAALPGRDVGALLAQAEARGLIHRAVNGGEDDVVLFCGSGTTGAVDKLVRVLPLADAVVFLGPYEHHSHELPWRESAADVVTSARPPAAAWTWPTWTAS
jgi:hypothetical protein